MLRRALQFQRKGQKSFPPQFWKQLYFTAIREGPDLRMAAKAVDPEHKPSPDMTKCSLPHLGSYFARTLFGQGLLQTSQSSSSLKLNTQGSNPDLRPMTSFVLGLGPPHRVIHVGEDKQDWLTLLHLFAAHRPARLQHDYTTSLLQVGDVMPVRSFPSMWEAATMIMIGKYKQGDVWPDQRGDVPCPAVCRNDKYQTADGYLTPANIQFIAFNNTAKYSILPAKGERVVVTYILMRPEHIASYQRVLLTKHFFPAPACAYLGGKRLTKKGPDPYAEDMDMKELWECADQAGSQ